MTIDNVIVRVCPVEGCSSFTMDEPNLPCAIHGLNMIIEPKEGDDE